MTQTRRTFIARMAAGASAITVLPFAAHAEAHTSDTFHDGAITVHPVHHASFVMETPAGVIYVDPVGEAAEYADLPPPDLILVTHEHGDHYNAETLAALIGDGTVLLTNPAVNAMLPAEMKDGAKMLDNGASTDWEGVNIEAIPAHNTTEERMNFHPVGRDNGYVLSFDGFRVYISGDTEPTHEMLALENIDLCFLCMNLPFTMTAEQAAAAVQEFKPTFVYPYHYRGRDDGTQDPEAFAEMVGDASSVKMAGWYKEGEI
ncbi:MBL fold metallo-hydrolase [Salipiger sp.]|uniref:MBL fold metallo-hydrolase n=1 Tax=Salipiger sp. TaxID=2078585 RepID=UPI003A96D270